MPETIAKARLGPADPSDPKKMTENGAFAVQFNPTSLQFTIKNTLKEGSGKSKKQYISQTSGQLSLELIFDTTHTGTDVREQTLKVIDFMKPEAKTKAPPIVHFEWGTFMFRGMVDSYKETIDFFSATGVPLRASINLTLASQDKVFETSSSAENRQDNSVQAGGPNLDPTSAAQQAGDPEAARSIAADNNQESLRFSRGPLTVSADVKLGKPVAFASGGAGLGVGIGGGIGIGGGVGIGGSVSVGGAIGVQAGASAGIGVSGGGGVGIRAGVAVTAGGGNSFGVSATAGAFENLRTPSNLVGANKLDPSKLLAGSAAVGLATDSGATFSLGGQAKLEGSTALKADVGAQASLRAKIQFDDP